jgi:hypothetical protein
MPHSTPLGALAQALLAGEPTIELLVDRCQRVLGRNWRWLRPLARRYLNKFGGGARPRRRDVARFLRNDEGLQQALAKYSNEISVKELLIAPQQMRPVPAATAWDIPTIESTRD